MFDETEQTSTETDNIEPQESDAQDAALISQEALNLFDTPYDEALQRLKDVYNNTNWADKQDASERLAQASEHLSQYNQVKLEPKLPQSDVESLLKIMTDDTLDQNTKLKGYEDWRTDAKTKLYNESDADTLTTGKQTEDLIDAYATQLRRDLISGDKGIISDSVTRALSAAVSPLAGVVDLLFDTDVKDKLNQLTLDETNPELDDSVVAIGASVAGNVGGFITASAGGPVGVWGYLTAMVADQAKDIYDVALETSNDPKLASQAVVNSTPGILLGALGDRFVAGAFTSAVKGATKKSIANIAEAGAAEGFAETTGEIASRGALAVTVGDPNLKPDNKDILISLIAGTAAGSVIAGMGEGIKIARAKRLNDFIKSNLKKNDLEPPLETTPPLDGAPEVVTPEERNIKDVDDSFIATPQERAKADKLFEIMATPVETNPDADLSYAMQFPTDASLIDTYREKDITKPDVEESVEQKAEEDSITFDKLDPDKFFVVGSSKPNPNFVPVAPVMDLVTKLLGTMGLVDLQSTRSVNSPRGFYGAYDSAAHHIKFIRELFTNPVKARETIAHEAGHFVDFHYRKLKEGNLEGISTEGIEYKLARFYGKFSAEEAAIINKQGRSLSAAWRDGWGPDAPTVREYADRMKQAKLPPRDVGMIAYRNRTTEIQADIFSAMLGAPDWVKTNYPEVYDAFVKGTEAPEMADFKTFWDRYYKAVTTPEGQYDWFRENREAARQEERKIYDEAKVKRLDERKKGLVKDVKDAALNLHEAVLAKDSVGWQIWRKLEKGSGVNSKEAKAAAKAMLELQAPSRTRTRLQTAINEPLKRLFQDYNDSGLPPKLWDDYEYINRIANETNAVLDSINKNPDTYIDALADVSTYLEADKNLNKISNELNKIVMQGVFQGISRSMKETKLAKNFADTLAAYKLYSDSVGVKQLRKYVNLKLNNLTKVIENKSDSTDVSDTDLQAFESFSLVKDLLDPNTFQVSRYVANPDGDYNFADQQLALIRNSLGDVNFEKLKNFSEQFHDLIFDNVIAKLDEAGLLTEDMLDKMKLNKYNYVTWNVLKYFQNSGRIPASIRARMGSIDKVGSTLAATVMKAESLLYRANLQMANNAAINLATMGDYKIEALPPKVFSTKKGPFFESMFKTKQALSLADKDSSFLIGTEKGVHTLYKINSPSFANMLAKSTVSEMKGFKALTTAFQGFEKLVNARGFLTVYNPVFVYLTQPIRDRSKEMYLAKSWVPSVLPMHIPGTKLSKNLAETKSVITKYIDGTITPEDWNTKEGKFFRFLLDNNALDHYIPEEISGLNYSTDKTVAETVYDFMGMPSEAEINLSLPDKFNKSWIHILRALNLDTVPGFRKGEALNFIGKRVGFEGMKRKAQIDEISAKVMAAKIAKDLGYNDYKAAVWARNYGGTPDPRGGGREASAINVGYMFGRATINGNVNAARIIGEDPKSYAFQFFYRKVLPRLIVTGSVMAPLISMLWGEDTAEVYKKWSNKIGEYEKEFKALIPWGFRDDDGNLVGFGVDPKDIRPSWRSEYIRIPVSYDLVYVDKMLTPFYKALSNLMDTGELDGKALAQDAYKAVTDAHKAGFAPLASAAIHTGQLLAGYNPTDFFRNKGIIKKDTYESGQFLKGVYEYLLWSTQQTFPFLLDRKDIINSYDQPTNPIQAMIDEYPTGIRGPMSSAFKAMIGSTNYGEFDGLKRNENSKKQLRAEVRTFMKPETLRAYDEWSRINYSKQRTPDWKLTATPSEKVRATLLSRWKHRMYQRGFEEIRAAVEKGDGETARIKSEQLEALTENLFSSLKKNNID